MPRFLFGLNFRERIFVTKEQKFNLIKRHLQQEVKNLTSKLNELKHDYLEEFVKVKARKNQVVTYLKINSFPKLPLS